MQIDSVSNKVTTECGHSFHCSCLMHNVLVNGFRCPYCRSAMAQRTPATGHLSDRLASITLPVALPNAPAFEPVSPTGPPPDFTAPLPNGMGPGLAAEEALDASIRESLLALADLFAPEPPPQRIRVKRATLDGKSVWMTDDNTVYNPDTREEIGKWDSESESLQQYDDSLDLWLTVWTRNSGEPMPMEQIL